ncbi:hypothetical protein HanIR_Chr08g0378561 [Helianthus annuus]|nr:hypothetical protein HanIR_Chr08g0378561 [Helianthus annuus]
MFPIDEPYLVCCKVCLDTFDEHVVNCIPGFKSMIWSGVFYTMFQSKKDYGEKGGSVKFSKGSARWEV